MRIALLLVLITISGWASAQSMSDRDALGTLMRASTTNSNRVTVPKSADHQRFEVQATCPVFALPQRERMFVEGNDREFVAGMRSFLMASSPVGLTVMEGRAGAGDLLLVVTSKTVSGGEEFESWDNGSYSNSYNSRYRRSGSYSSRYSSRDSCSSREKSVAVYTQVQMTLYRIDCEGNREVVVAPSARVAGSDSAPTARSERESYSSSRSYGSGWGRSSSRSSSSASGSSWRRDESFEREMLKDNLSFSKYGQAASVLLRAWQEKLLRDRYESLVMSETSASRSTTSSGRTIEIDLK